MGDIINGAPSVITISTHCKYGIRHSISRLLTLNGWVTLQRRGLGSDFKDLIHSLGTYGIPIFYATGNGVGRALNLVEDPVQAYSKQFDNFLVVGSTDKKGHVSSRSAVDSPSPNDYIISSWAPGTDLTCIRGTGDGVDKNAHGTSFATPLTTGVAAYAMGLPNRPRKPADIVRRLSAHSVKRTRDGTQLLAWLETIWRVLRQFLTAHEGNDRSI